MDVDDSNPSVNMDEKPIDDPSAIIGIEYSVIPFPCRVSQKWIDLSNMLRNNNVTHWYPKKSVDVKMGDVLVDGIPWFLETLEEDSKRINDGKSTPVTISRKLEIIGCQEDEELTHVKYTVRIGTSFTVKYESGHDSDEYCLVPFTVVSKFRNGKYICVNSCKERVSLTIDEITALINRRGGAMCTRKTA